MNLLFKFKLNFFREMVQRNKKKTQKKSQQITEQEWTAKTEEMFNTLRKCTESILSRNDDQATKLEEINSKLSEFTRATDLESLYGQAESLELQEENSLLIKLSDLVKQARSISNMNNSDAQLRTEEAIRLATEEGLLVENFEEFVSQEAQTFVALNFDHIKRFVEGQETGLPEEILKSLSEISSAVRDFVTAYPGWFNQPVSNAVEKAIDASIDSFVDMELEPSFSEKIISLQKLINSLQFIAELKVGENDSKDYDLMQVITDIVDSNEFITKDVKTIKNIKNQVDQLRDCQRIVNHTDSSLIKTINDLTVYIWRLEASVLLSKNNKKGSKQLKELLSNIHYEVLQYRPEELTVLAEQLKLSGFEGESVKDKVIELCNIQNLDRSFLNTFTSQFIADQTLTDTDRYLAIQFFKYTEIMLAESPAGNFEDSLEKMTELGLAGTQLFFILEKIAKVNKNCDTFREYISKRMFKASSAYTVEDLNKEFLIDFSIAKNTIDIYRELEGIVDAKLIDQNSSTIDMIESRLCAFTQANKHLEILVNSKQEEFEDPSEMEVILSSILTRQNLSGITNATFLSNINSLQSLFLNKGDEKMVEEKLIEKIKQQEDSKETSQEHPSLETQEIPEKQEIRQTQEFMEEETQEATQEIVQEHTSEEKIVTPKKAEDAAALAKKNPLTLEDALKMAEAGEKPSSFKHSTESFKFYLNGVKSMYNELLDMGDKIHYTPLKKNIEALRTRPLKLGDKFDELSEIYAKAKIFNEKVFKMKPEEVQNNIEKLDAEYQALGVEINEFLLLKEDVNSNKLKIAEITRALEEERESLSLAEWIGKKNLYESCRYYKNMDVYIKLIDVYIMALIKAYKIHDHENGACVIHYEDLRELCGIIKLNSSPTECKIKPDNAAFIQKMFEKVKQYMKKNVYILSLQEIQLTTPRDNFMRFVDLSEKIREYKNRLLEKTCVTKDGKKSSKAIKPSGKKSIINNQKLRKIKPSAHEIPKPAFENKVTKQLRSYYYSSFCHLMDKNPHLVSLKLHQVAQNLERTLAKKFVGKPLNYDKIGDSMIHILGALINHRYCTKAWRRNRLSYEFLLKFKGLKKDKLAEENKRFQRIFNQEKASQKNQTMLGKRIRSASKEDPNEIYLDSSTLIPSGHMTYALYSDKLTISTVGNQARTFGEVTLKTFTTQSNLNNVTLLPELTLNGNVKYDVFQNYIKNIFEEIKSRSKKYSLNQGWVASGNSSLVIASQLIKEKNVASIQYSKRCKIFLFPKQAIPSEWLEKMDFWADGPHVELFYLIITKRTVNKFETPAMPKPTGGRLTMMYRLRSKHHVQERDIFRPTLKAPVKNPAIQHPVSRPDRLPQRRPTAADLFKNAPKAARAKKENLFDDLLDTSKLMEQLRPQNTKAVSRPAERSGLQQLFSNRREQPQSLVSDLGYQNSLINYLKVPMSRPAEPMVRRGGVNFEGRSNSLESQMKHIYKPKTTWNHAPLGNSGFKQNAMFAGNQSMMKKNFAKQQKQRYNNQQTTLKSALNRIRGSAMQPTLSESIGFLRPNMRAVHHQSQLQGYLDSRVQQGYVDNGRRGFY